MPRLTKRQHNYTKVRIHVDVIMNAQPETHEEFDTNLVIAREQVADMEEFVGVVKKYIYNLSNNIRTSSNDKFLVFSCDLTACRYLEMKPPTLVGTYWIFTIQNNPNILILMDQYLI